MSQINSATPPVASVVITTRNRKEELLGAIESCLTQSVPIEILILDDASDDGGPDAVLEKFPPEKYPQVRMLPQSERVGLIVLRNRAARLVTTNFIFSIDDDALFTTPHIVEQTLRDFDHPRVGAVAIPFKNIRISNELNQRAPNDTDVYAAAEYIGTSHAVRRDLFLQLAGYRECFIHQGEESDYCLRLLNAGYVVRMGRADEVHHLVSPKRDMSRIHFYGSRNNVLFACFNVGLVQLPLYLAGTIVNSLRNAVRVKAVGIKIRAIGAGLRDAIRYKSERRPVSSGALRLFRELRKSPQPLSAIMDRLPPLSAGATRTPKGPPVAR